LLCLTIVVVAGAIGVRWLQAELAERYAEIITPGSVLPPIDGIAYTDGRAVLFFLSADCPYCQAETPFYRSALDTAHSRNAGSRPKVYAVSPDDRDHFRQYLHDAGLRFDKVIAGTPPVVGVPVVPMIVVIERGGTVVRRWVGQLEEIEKAAVFHEFTDDVRPASSDE
jgi:hypothetical protein